MVGLRDGVNDELSNILMHVVVKGTKLGFECGLLITRLESDFIPKFA